LFEFLKTIGVEPDKDELKEAFTFDGKVEKELTLAQLKSEVCVSQVTAASSSTFKESLDLL
jgi:hypothetical protein